MTRTVAFKILIIKHIGWQFNFNKENFVYSSTRGVEINNAVTASVHSFPAIAYISGYSQNSRGISEFSTNITLYAALAHCSLYTKYTASSLPKLGPHPK